MTESAAAIVLSTPGNAELRGVKAFELRPHDVLIRTAYSGISTGTDRWVMQGRFTWNDFSWPLVPGYQRSGIVEAIGDSVASVAIGQHVVATASIPFEEADAGWGSHAALAVSVEHEVFDGTGIPLLRSCLLVSAQVGVNAASRITAPDGAAVVVVGDGIIGSSAALAALARGYRVLVLGRHEERLAPLRDFGVNTNATVAEWSPVAAIDTAQSDESFAAYVDELPTGFGEIVFSGHSPGGVTSWADMELMQKRELTAHFVSGWTRARLERTLELMKSGDLAVDRLIGTVADSAVSATELANSIIVGGISSTAAAIDWSAIS
jgi:bacteriochlorophyllide a dehydrogenase